MSTTPIADYALISDCQTAALVSRRGSVDWLCLPRFDSPSALGRILDDGAGHWSIHPTTEATVTRRYLDRTMVLQTTFRTDRGTVAVVDALCFGAGNRDHDIGKDAPHVLLRVATVVDGEVELDVEWAPRPEYGLIHPLLQVVDGGVRAKGGADSFVLSSPRPLSLEGSTARGRVALRAGERAAFALAHGSSWHDQAIAWTAEKITARLDDTIAGWRSWSAHHQRYEGPYADLVHHSGRVLQALTFQPSGAIVAAPTTSLPETVGGERNWDYRYAWVRDASFTIEALWVAACPDEANEFFGFMSTAAASSVARGADLQIMFGVGGERDLSERQLPHLTGWRDSAPVRVGNGAWEQRQIDVYGELLSAVARLSDHLDDDDEATLAFFVALADGAAARWHDRDQGIWEVRGEPRHFVYSKLMCWVALDRAIALAERLPVGDRLESWTATRDEIASTILAEGWSDTAKAFTQSFGSDELDASNLMISLVGLLPPDDPRVLATIDATEERLTDDRGLVYRYLAEDGLEGEEGTFLLCTFWLAQALARSGRPDRARAVFDRAVRYVNDVGLLAEEVDPTTGELLGNFPQAFSHIGLVNAAWAINEAEGRAVRHQRSTGMTTPPPPDLVSTREALRALACYVIAPKRKALTGCIGLRPTGDGIGTPWFDDGTRVAVRGNRLLLEPRADIEITTLRAAAEFLDVVLSSEPGVGHDLPPFSPDGELTVDADASRWLGSWYDFAGRQLDRLRAELAVGTVSEAQLWPEHFDLAVVVTVGDDTVNVGFSPGDAAEPEPYVYVGPHDRAGLDDPYWNAPFGAVLRHADLQAPGEPGQRAHDFVRNGLQLVAAARRERDDLEPS